MLRQNLQVTGLPRPDPSLYLLLPLGLFHSSNLTGVYIPGQGLFRYPAPREPSKVGNTCLVIIRIGKSANGSFVRLGLSVIQSITSYQGQCWIPN